jgi:hypothetical protein
MDDAMLGIITGAIGVVGALAGTGFTQWRSDVREQGRLEVEERREQARLQAEVERERDTRLFDHRRVAYAAVIGEYLKWAALGDDVKKGRAPSPPENANDDFWRLVLDVRMLGSKKTGEAVQDLYFAVCELVWPGTMGGSKEPEWDAMDAFEKFQDAARADLGVPQPKRFKDMEIKLPD